MCYYLGFGSFSALLGGLGYYWLYHNTDWNPYLLWILAWSGTTFLLYGLDKGLSKGQGARTPEMILHLLALVGGFPGGWLGRAAFKHKTNVRKHPWFLIVLVLSTVGHGLLIYYWFLSGP